MKANCKHLTHKYPSYFGCTIGEVSIISAIYIILDIVIAAFLSLFFGLFFIFFIGLFLMSYFLIKFTSKKIGIFKEGKQQGYIVLKGRQILSQKIGFVLPYITRCGKWITKREVFV